MASSPELNIYDQHGKYQGCMKHAEDAAIVIGVWGGGSIRWNHKYTVWDEGEETQGAAESYDFVATTVNERIEAHNRFPN